MKYKIQLVFLALLLFPGIVYGKCLPSKLEICTKMTLLSAKKFSLKDIFFERAYSHCKVVFKEVDSEKKWTAYVSDCPSIDGQAYIYIKYACNDTGGDYPDTLQIWENSECETSPAENLKRVKEAVSKLRPGASLSEFQKIGLRPTNRYDEARGTSEYHSYPGVSTHVKWDKKCPNGLKDCSYEAARTSLVSFTEPEQKFLTKKECEMWKGVATGGKVIKGSWMPLKCELAK